MKLFRPSIAAVLAVFAMSLCTVPSRGDTQYYASTGVRGTSETVTITDTNINGSGRTISGGYYTNYYTNLSTSSSGSNPVYYNTFCVDITHEASTTYNPLATTGFPPLTSSYSGGTAINPETVSDTALGYAAWLANTYSASATTPDQQAGLQIAIWKILYNTDRTAAGLEDVTGATYNSVGDISFTNNSPATTDAAYYVTQWVNHGEQSSSAYLVNYAGPDSGTGVHAQYQLITYVPEPSTMAIACLGVLGFAGYGLKRSRRRA